MARIKVGKKAAVRPDVMQLSWVEERGDSSPVAADVLSHSPDTRISNTLIGDIKIEQVILHELDNQRQIMNLVDEPATFDEQIEDFFATHIAAAATRAEWHARFDDVTGELPDLCRHLLGDAERFVNASKLLAQRLYSEMRPKNIAAGDFVALVYVMKGVSSRQIALLKLDPDEHLIREFQRKNGRNQVTISRAANVLPGSGKLHKCALLVPDPESADFGIRLLDTQAGPHSEGVAAFFYRRFLKAKLSPSPRRYTRKFILLSEQWLSNLQSGDNAKVLKPKELFEFYAARRRALMQSELDIAVFTGEALPARPQMSGQLGLFLSEQLSEGETGNRVVKFVVDEKVASSIIHTITLELDHETRIKVSASKFDELVRIEPDLTCDGKYLLTLETLTLRESLG